VDSDIQAGGQRADLLRKAGARGEFARKPLKRAGGRSKPVVPVSVEEAHGCFGINSIHVPLLLVPGKWFAVFVHPPIALMLASAWRPHTPNDQRKYL
jgi:hypothetical protein